MSISRLASVSGYGPVIQGYLVRRLLPVVAMLVAAPLSAYAADPGPKVGDSLPDATFVSIEGMQVALKPPEGKLLHVHFWYPDVSITDELAKSAVVLFRRFHSKGLNTLTVCFSRREERPLYLAEKWNLPWPVVLLHAGQTGPLQNLGVKGPHFNMFVDDKGRIVAVNLKGEQAHAEIARLLNVNPADLPMPEAPEPRKVRKPQDSYTDDRDLVHGNGKVYLAATPISENSIQLVWSARGLPGGAGHWKDNYAVYMAEQRELFAPYRAELQVAHDFKKTFRKIAEVPAGSQQFTWNASPAGKLLWYRLVLRDKDGRVAAVSDVAPGVTGKNLVPNPDLERPVQADGKTASESTWSLVARKSAKPKEYGQAKIAAGASRLFSPGKQSVSGEAGEKLTLATPPLPVEAKRYYLMGAWLQARDGVVTFERISLDAEKQAIGGAVTLRALAGKPWIFCAHRLAPKDDMKGNPQEWEELDAEQANLMPGDQSFLRFQVFLEASACQVDDAFLLAYEEAKEADLESLPAAESVKADPETSTDFVIRREQAVEREEAQAAEPQVRLDASGPDGKDNS